MKKINFKKILKKRSPYIIAEIGVNHESSFFKAEKMIRQAKLGGADAVKFQTYKANLLASKKSPYYWDLKKVSIKSQYELFKKFDKFNESDFIKLKKICDKYKITFCSTPFDSQSALFLNKLVSFFKIASADFTNLPLIDLVCSFGKPVLISTGACTILEIMKLKSYICKKYPKVEIIFMHCVLSYPTDYKFANLQQIKLLKVKLKTGIIGYSDHTMPDKSMLVLLESYRYGAQIIEKHFTSDDLKGHKNNDHFHSMDFNDLKILRNNLELIKIIKGKKEKRKILACEIISRKNARRSIFTFTSMKKGEKFSNKNIIPKRPGDGISTMKINKILDKKATKNLPNDHKLKWSDIT